MATPKLLREAKKAGIDLKKLFPKSKINGNRTPTKYQAKKIQDAIKSRHRKKSRKHTERVHAKHGRVLYPDKPIHYEKAGYLRIKNAIYYANKFINIHTIYKHEGLSSFYSASFFGGEIHAQLIPLINLADFLEQQAEIDDSEGAWYDKITLKENDRDMWGQSGGFTAMQDTAQDLLEYLMQYKRHGALIGAGQSYEYIQVCFIQLA